MSLNVLLVDDSAVMRQMLRKTLHLSRIPLGDVHEASNGQEGLEALDRHWIDLMLLDISMPVMRGDEMLRRVRDNPATADLSVVVVSSEPARERLLSAADPKLDFVQKPFTPDQIRDTILRLTGVSDEPVDREGAVPDGDLDF